MRYLKFVILLLLPLSLIRAQQETGYRVGDAAQDFKLKNIDGKMVSMADYKSAKGFIIIFTCNHCPFAKAYEQRIIELSKKYGSEYPVIAINPNDPVAEPEDSWDEMVKRAREKAYPFPYLFDETQEIAKAYGAKKTPHVYVLSKQQKNILRVDYIGAIDDNFNDAASVKEKYVEKAIEAISKGKKPELTATKAVGCGIKWKK